MILIKELDMENTDAYGFGVYENQQLVGKAIWKLENPNNISNHIASLKDLQGEFSGDDLIDGLIRGSLHAFYQRGIQYCDMKEKDYERCKRRLPIKILRRTLKKEETHVLFSLEELFHTSCKGRDPSEEF